MTQTTDTIDLSGTWTLASTDAAHTAPMRVPSCPWRGVPRRTILTVMRQTISWRRAWG